MNNDELRSFMILLPTKYYSGDPVKVHMRGVGLVASMQEKRNAYRILVEKSEGK
jgi:hypothetical protein